MGTRSFSAFYAIRIGSTSLYIYGFTSSVFYLPLKYIILVMKVKFSVFWFVGLSPFDNHLFINYVKPFIYFCDVLFTENVMSSLSFRL